MSKQYYSKSLGQKNPNSKNPAAGGQVRSKSSLHSPAVGNVAERSQKPKEDVPFVRAIVSCIRNSARQYRVSVDHNNVVSFAKHYASSMPEILHQFPQSEVDQALIVFQESQQLPAPAPAPSPPPQPRNPRNLFGQLMAVAKHWNLPRDLLLSWLKWYTSQTHISPTAENPTHEEFIIARTEMERQISPSAQIFRDVCEHGLSSETVGPKTFQELMGSSNAPHSDHIWAVPECPNPKKLQELLYFERVGQKNHVCCFVAGICFHPDGTTSVFSTKPSRKQLAPGFNPHHMVGLPAIIWTTKIGEFQFVHRVDHGAVQKDYESARGCGKFFYVGNGAMCEVTNPRIFSAQLMDFQREDTEEARFAGGFVCPREKGELPSDDESLRSNVTYKQLANQAMAQIGGISISFKCQGQQEAAEAVLSSSEPQVQQATRNCKHGIWGGGEVLGKCTKCDWGQK